MVETTKQLNWNNISMSTIAYPLKEYSLKNVDVGYCGLIALGAKNSVYLYSSTLQLIRTIELSRSNVLSLKFHPEKPLLAISDDASRVVLWDCVKGVAHGFSKALPESKKIVQLRWMGDVLLGLSSPSTVFGIDFWPFESDDGAKNCRIAFRIDITGTFTQIHVDPFASNKFMLLSNNSTITIIQGEDSNMSRVTRKEMKLNIPPVCIVYHPHIPDVLLFTYSNQICLYHTSNGNLTTILHDESTAPFINSIIYPVDHRKIFIVARDSSVIMYTLNDNLQYLKKASIRLKRDSLILFCPSRSDCLYTHSKESISLLNVKTDSLEVKLQTNLVPLQFTAFTQRGSTIVVGTQEGQIIGIDALTATIEYHFQPLESPITLVKPFGDRIVFASKKESGVIDLVNKNVKLFDVRAGPVISITTTSELCLLQRGSHVISVLSTSMKETLLTFEQEIMATSIQTARTPATCFAGDIPNFAVLLKGGSLQLFASSSSSPVRLLRVPTPDPRCVAWKADVFATADNSGQLFFHDLSYEKSRLSMSLQNPSRIEFDYGPTGLYVLSQNTLGLFSSTFETCPVPVIDFSIANSSLILVETEDNSLKYLYVRDWRTARPAPVSLNQDQPYSDVMKVTKHYFHEHELEQRLCHYGNAEDVIMSIKLQALASGHGPIRLLCSALTSNKNQLREDLLTMGGFTAPIAAAFVGCDEGVSKYIVDAGHNYFESGLDIEGWFMLALAGHGETVPYLYNDREMWNKCSIAARIYEDTHIISIVARRLLDIHESRRAMLFLASIGEFHAVVSILHTLKERKEAYEIMKYAESKNAFVKSARLSEPAIIDFDYLKVQVIEKYEKHETK